MRGSLSIPETSRASTRIQQRLEVELKGVMLALQWTWKPLSELRATPPSLCGAAKSFCPSHGPVKSDKRLLSVWIDDSACRIWDYDPQIPEHLPEPQIRLLFYLLKQEFNEGKIRVLARV